MNTRIGVIGCGDICRRAYLEGLRAYPGMEIAAFADVRPEAARAMAALHGNARALSVDGLLAATDIELVVNLTTPAAHAPLNLRALEHSKHVYCEKPFCTTRDEGRAVLDLAAKNNLLAGGAPDTFLGDALQTARHLLDDGAIGRPTAGVAFMLCGGHEHWHPNPEFYYARGGGPMLDMGPYYLTALASLLGPVRRVSAFAGAAFAQRQIISEPKRGQMMGVETPTHLTGLLEFHNGALITTIFSFDNFGHRLPHLEIHGDAGSLFLPDPNHFSGEVTWRKRGQKRGDPALTPSHPHTHGGARGIGVANMAAAIRRPGRGFRANGALAYHVFDVMQAFFDSASSERAEDVSSTCERPSPLPVSIKQGDID